MTGRDLVSAALRQIGAIAPGESPSADEATDALAAINRLIDSWSNENLLIYSVVRDSLTLTGGDASYTYGTSGDLNSARPQSIVSAAIRVETSSPAIEYPLRVVTASEWAFIAQKDFTSSIPTDVYFEGTYPLETINLFPVPTDPHKLVIYALKPLTSISTLDTDIALPPGYERALVFNGAVELAGEWGKQASETVMYAANESKGSIKRRNRRPDTLRCDSIFVSEGPYNIYIGGYR